MPTTVSGYDNSMKRKKNRKMVSDALKKKMKEEKFESDFAIKGPKSEPKREPMTPAMRPSMVDKPEFPQDMSQEQRRRKTLKFFKRKFEQDKTPENRKALQEALKSYKMLKSRKK